MEKERIKVKILKGSEFKLLSTSKDFIIAYF